MHLCIAGSVRAMPEKEKPPAMPVDIYSFRGFVSLLVDNRQLRTDFFVNHVAVFVVHVTDLAEE